MTRKLNKVYQEFEALLKNHKTKIYLTKDSFMSEEYFKKTYDNYDKFKEGMVVTIEPGLYEIGNLGIRIEDDVLLTDKGYRCLTSFSKEIQII